MSVFQYKLRECRKERGYTQEKLCELLNVSRDKLSKWENGSRTPDLNELCKICDIFECDLDYLVGRIEQKTNKLQNACEITGLSIESVKKLEAWNNILIHQDQTFSDLSLKEQHETIGCMDNLLKKYPELLHDINAALLSTNTDTECLKNIRAKKAMTDRERKALCMKVALNLWNYIDTGKKYHPFEKQNISKFASDFIYDRLSFLETALHNENI